MKQAHGSFAQSVTVLSQFQWSLKQLQQLYDFRRSRIQIKWKRIEDLHNPMSIVSAANALLDCLLSFSRKIEILIEQRCLLVQW